MFVVIFNCFFVSLSLSNRNLIWNRFYVWVLVRLFCGDVNWFFILTFGWLIWNRILRSHIPRFESFGIGLRKVSRNHQRFIIDYAMKFMGFIRSPGLNLKNDVILGIWVSFENKRTSVVSLSRLLACSRYICTIQFDRRISWRCSIQALTRFDFFFRILLFCSCGC